MAIFGAGYGDSFGLDKTAMSGQNQVLTQWSGEVLRLGRDMLVFSRFLSNTPPGIVMGLSKGDTFRIPIFTWIEETAGTTALTSGTVIPLLTQGTLNVYGTLDEYGRGIGLENAIEYYTKVGRMEELLVTLADNRARVINELCRAIIHNTGHKYSATTGGITNDNSTAGTAKTEKFTSTTAKAVHDLLKKSKVPTYPNGLYVYVGNAEHLRSLKNEGVFETYSYYNNTSFGLNGIVYQVLGNWEGFTFIQTEEGMASHYGYALAPEVGAQAYAKPVSLYYYPDINSDAGRLNVVKWHMIAGFAKTLRDYGTRALRVWTT